MKSKIKYICIEGVEKSGKTLVSKELRRFLKEEKGVEIEDSDSFTQSEGLFIRKRSIISDIYDGFKRYEGSVYLQNKYTGELLKEQHEKFENGSVIFFLIPSNLAVIQDRFDVEKKQLPFYTKDVWEMLKQINSQSICSGLDVRLIYFDQYDSVIDIKNKIYEILEKDFTISS